MTDPVADFRELLEQVPAGLWIGGTSVDASDGSTFSVDDPATGTWSEEAASEVDSGEDFAETEQL